MKDVFYEDFIDKLRLESDIVSVISEYVSLKKKGKNYWGCCPFHNEKTPSFSVTPDKGFFYCFGCQSGGNVFNFLMKIENITFFESAKLLAKKMNIPFPEKEKSKEELVREHEKANLYHITELARDFFYACLTKSSYGKDAQQYLLTRGITADIIETFKLGFSPPAWNKLTTTFLNRDIDVNLLMRAGLSVERTSGDGCYDRFRNRIMFPIMDLHGRVVGFGGRVIDNNSQPKYLNSPETLIFNKRNILFGLHIADSFIKKMGQAIIVEGYMDAITAHSAGIKNVVASLGTAFTLEQAKLLRHAKEIIFAYDNDTAGQNATIRALEIIRKQGMKVKVICIPDGKDPDDFIRKNGAQAFQVLIDESLSLLDFQVKQSYSHIDYSTLEGKVAVVTKALPALASAENAVEMNNHIAGLAETLAIDESAIRTELKKFLVYNEKDKNVNKGNPITMLVRQHTDIVEQAEQNIIRLMCDNDSIIPYIQEHFSVEDVQDETRKEIIELVFSAYNKGESTNDMIGNSLLDEGIQSELSRIMLIDIQYNEITKVVDDCLKVIRLKNLKNIYEQHRLRADELERMGDNSYLQELAESQRIKNEINKLQHS